MRNKLSFWSYLLASALAAYFPSWVLLREFLDGERFGVLLAPVAVFIYLADAARVEQQLAILAAFWALLVLSAVSLRMNKLGWLLVLLSLGYGVLQGYAAEYFIGRLNRVSNSCDITLISGEGRKGDAD